MSIPRLPVPWRTPVATAQPNLVEVAHFTDAACPWAYNFEPTLRALEARYGDQLNVRTVMIGLSESYEDYGAESRSPERLAVKLGRTAASDGPDRYTAPSLVLRAEGRELIAPGYQPFEAVDVLVMNLVPQAERLPVPSLAALLGAYPG